MTLPAVKPASDGMVPSVPAAVTPMQMLQMAVTQGADLDRMKQLMDLHERWEANEARKAFVEALNVFKADAPRIVKDKQVSFQTAKGKTEYRHALSGVASEIIGQALARVGISHRWDVVQDGAKITVTCILTHSRGHSERVSLTASPDDSGGKNSIQAIGSAVSYLQRYTLFAATGLVPKDADDDGTGGASPHALDERVKVDFLAAIESLADKKAAESLWQTIASECAKAGDVEGYAELRAAYAKKFKGLQ